MYNALPQQRSQAGVRKRQSRLSIPARFARRVVAGAVRSARDLVCRRGVRRAQQILLHSERRLRRQNEALVELARRPFVGDLSQDVHHITEVAARTLVVARCGMWLYAEDRAALRCIDMFDATSGKHAAGMALSESQYPAYFAAMEADRTIAVADAHCDPRTLAFSADYLTPLGIGALLDAPVRVNGKTLGVICLEHVGGPRRWTADEEGFAESIGTLVAVAIESAERAQVQTALRASEERFRAFMDNSPLVAFIKDDHGVRYVSAAFNRMFGLDRQTIAARPDNERWPDHAASLRKNDLAVWHAGRAMEFIEHLPVADGTVRRFLSFKFPIPVPPGEPRLLGGIAVDLTERYATDEARAKLAAIVEGCDDAILSVSSDGVILSWNGGAERMFGYTDAEARGKSLSILAAPGRPDEWQTILAKAMDGQRLRHIETVRRRKDGRLIDVSLSVSHTRDADGAIVTVAGIFRDISDRKRFEQALAESERFARSTVDALTDHIAIIDEVGEILAVNLAWREFAVANDLRMPQCGLNSNYLAVCDASGGQGQAAAEGIREIIRGERERFDFEYPCHSPREQRWFAMRVTRFSGEGSMRLVVCHENITERKRNETLQREQGSLRGAVTAMEQVLGVVGHELRTPLAGLRAMSEFLLTDGASDTQEATQFLTSMNEEVVRMGDTVDQLLEAARLNSGRAKWNWSEFSLRQVCEEALDTVRPLVDQPRVRVTCDVRPGDLRMRGDGDAIRRLVLNLAGNARKHTSEGEIRVTARPSEDSAGLRWVEIRVSDTGEGIPPEIVSRLGEAFALNSGIVGACHVSGTGLGLAICKGIAAAHRGMLVIESSIERGTTMTVRCRADLPGPACGESNNMVSSATIA